jgi:hypothetical protein
MLWPKKTNGFSNNGNLTEMQKRVLTLLALDGRPYTKPLYYFQNLASERANF